MSDRASKLRKRRELTVRIQNDGQSIAVELRSGNGALPQILNLSPPQFLVLNLLNGERTEEEILLELQSHPHWDFDFENSEEEASYLRQIIEGLQRSRLAVSAHTAVPAEQLEKGNSRPSFFRRFINWPIAVELPLLRSDRFVSKVYDAGGHYLVSNTAVAVSVLIWALALMGFIGGLSRFARELSGFSNFLSAENALSLFLAVVLVKTLHEWGHALWAKRWGLRVDEMGILFLVGMPCYYCTVNQVALLNSRLKKLTVALGGIYIELTVASIAVFVWLITSPGFIHHLALSTIIVASVHTLLFNMFPLLRYDGYYALAFLWGRDNLRRDATDWVRSVFAYWLTGDAAWKEHNETYYRRDKHALFLMGVLSSCYGWFIMLQILLFLYRYGEPYGELFGAALFSFGAWYLVIRPIRGLIGFLRSLKTNVYMSAGGAGQPSTGTPF